MSGTMNFDEPLEGQPGYTPGCPAGVVVHTYDFTDDVEGWASVDTAKQSVTFDADRGAMILTSIDSTATCFALDPAASTVVRGREIEADLTITAGTSAGLIFNHISPTNYLLVMIVAGGFKNGVYLLTTPPTFGVAAYNQSFKLSPSAPIRLLIRHDGPIVSVYVNGTFAFESIQPPALTSRIGVGAIDGTVRADRIRVRTLDETTMSESTGTIGTGNGDIRIDHDFGGPDALRIVEGSDGVDDVLLTAYRAGQTRPDAQTRTASDGRWIAPLMLDPGTYTLIVSAPGRQSRQHELMVANAD